MKITKENEPVLRKQFYLELDEATDAYDVPLILSIWAKIDELDDWVFNQIKKIGKS